MRKIIAMSLMSFILTACYGERLKSLTVETVCPDKPNCVSSLTSVQDKKVEPFILKKESQSWNELDYYLKQQPNVLMIVSNDTTLQMEYKTKWLRFVDDVILHRNGYKVDIRSSSRVGYSDLGANRKRIENLRDDLKSLKIIK